MTTLKETPVIITSNHPLWDLCPNAKEPILARLIAYYNNLKSFPLLAEVQNDLHPHWIKPFSEKYVDTEPLPGPGPSTQRDSDNDSDDEMMDINNHPLLNDITIFQPEDEIIFEAKKKKIPNQQLHKRSSSMHQLTQTWNTKTHPHPQDLNTIYKGVNSPSPISSDEDETLDKDVSSDTDVTIF